ncbi:acyl-CoA synthetase [Paludibacterium yongneupense]|uniref:LpxL/LpxP family acyltransferase n=1 Tax=Paludibacterium yongneupense TaxID=400061 RepID=UPI0003F83E43|nr:acyl-CoA synthetase [Paludibacterium yongneupense]
MTSPAAAWRTRDERGSLTMLRLMTWISLQLGRPVGRAVLRLVTAYFMATNREARAASRAYLARVLQREIRHTDVYRHLLTFASTVHDRVYLLNDRFDLFDVEVEGEDIIAGLVAERRGAFLLGSHHGSFEIIRTQGRRCPDLRIALMMYSDNARKINAALDGINPGARPDIIELGHINAMLQARERLDDGVVIGMLGDRSLAEEEGVTLPFLGENARFPSGPLRIAALLRRPVVFMSGIYLGGNRYRVRFEQLADFSVPGPRSAALAAAQAAYVAALERNCRAAPYNWFNFFDFWRAPVRDAARTNERSHE